MNGMVDFQVERVSRIHSKDGGVVVALLKRFVALAIVSLALSGCSGIDRTFSGFRTEPFSEPLAPSKKTPESSDPSAEERPPGDSSGLIKPESSAETTVETETKVYRGSGNFLNRDRARRQPVHEAADGNVSLNFIDVEIAEVVRSVLSETLRLNYVIDPRVQGKVTLRTSRPIARGAILPTLENILAMSGVAIVRADGLYRILPASEAAGASGVPRLRERSDESESGYGVDIVPLRHISAEEMAAILEPFAKSGNIVRIDTSRNLLMLAGTGRERHSMADIVDIFDVDWLSGMSFAVVPLRSADASAVLTDLRAVFGDEAKGPLAGLVRFLPIERVNGILVISQRPEHVERAREWIERLDFGGDSQERRLFVYYVQNSRAIDLAQVLGSIFGGEGATPEETIGDVAPGLTPTQISSSGSVPRAVTPSTDRDPTPERTSTTQRRAFGAARTNTSPPVQSATPAKSASFAIGSTGRIRIIADDKNNALFILATPQDYRQVEAALRSVDIVPIQVLIEATIAEVSLNKELRYGVRWFFKAGGSQLTFSDAATGAVVSSFPGFSYLFSSGSDIRLVLNALDSVTDINVISSPQLMVLDNRTAELQVGDQVPVATQSAVSNVDPDAPTVNTIELRDTGVILKVTPRVNASGLVSLDIEQEVSDVVPTTTSGIDSPTIQQRRILSSVAVQSGETVALGGLIRDRRTNARSAVPILGEIPILGNLFGATTKERDKTELLVLITPRVVRNAVESRAVTDELRRKIKTVQPLTDGWGRK